MPTTCDCGAGVPHGHSLFILQGHHHGPDGAVFGATDAEHHGHHQHNYHDEYSPATGPQLDGRITHNADRVVLTMPQLDEDAGTWQRIRYADSERTLRGGRVDTPEPPPPRIYPAS